MTPTLTIVGLWAAFAATHLLLSGRSWRPKLVAGVGLNAFLTIYSLIALGLFLPLVQTYWTHRHAGPALWMLLPSPWRQGVVLALMTLACVLLVASLARPSPSSILAGAPVVQGPYRITRHPLFAGLGLFGVAHLLVNGFASDVAFFAGFPLFGLIGGWHQDQRKLRDAGPGFAAFHRDTAMLRPPGRAWTQGLRELPVGLVVAGVATAAVLRWLHRWWVV